MSGGEGRIDQMNTNANLNADTGDIRFLRRLEAAHYVQTTYGFPCSRQWLAKLAVVGGGPVYRKAGRTPIYAPSDLDTWAASRIGAPQRSTSDVQA
jgi:hypothetical protein